MTELESLREQLRDFAAVRDWGRYHSPKNLAMALSVEAAELLETFQWMTEEQSRNLAPEALATAGDEIADVLLYLIRLSDELGIDPIAAANRKLLTNAEKYPTDKARGVVGCSFEGATIEQALSSQVTLILARPPERIYFGP